MQYANPTRVGAAVVARKAKSGRTTFSIKFVDGSGKQVWERLGTDDDGWTRAKARRELEQRLVDVRREGYRQPDKTTFGDVARDWLATYPVTMKLKRTTRESYTTVVNKYLLLHLGDLPIERLDVTALDRYVAARLRDGLSAASVNRHLNVVSLIVRAARKKNLLRANPVELVDRPKEARRRWRILTPDEIVRVRSAFAVLERDAADDDERAWVHQCSQVFVVVYATGMRRGELLGLRWQRVRLADPAGPVLRIDETFVAHQIDTPKSEASERTIPLGPVATDALAARYRDTAFQDEDDRVFCHPQTGGPLDRKRYADTFRAALAKAEVDGRVRPFHDGRHTAITNAAASGVDPNALKANAGHASFSTTQRYIDLAGVRFKAEAEIAEARMFGTQTPDEQA